MILLFLIIVPMVGGLLAWFLARIDSSFARWTALASLFINLIVAISIWIEQPLAGEPSQWIARFMVPWIPSFGISFSLAIDGLSLLMVILTFFLGILAVVTSWNEINYKAGFFHFNLLWVLAGITGVFLTMDLFLFYFFWEVMLIPMYLLIGIWGHENRRYAAYKFFIFTQASGLLMFLAILGLYYAHGNLTGTYTFDYFQLLNTTFEDGTGRWLMLGFLAAFIVKLPVVPFHSWLPDAHSEAPTAGSLILAGLLLKTGAYGLLRFIIPLFPNEAHEIAPWAMLLGVIGILYGALLAFSQTDLKRLVAYTSVSHMGFVMLGVFAFNELALQGVVMQMITHGISTGALFILAGSLYERIHTRNIESMGGFWKQMPFMGTVALIFAMASLGLPGLGNFIAEFLTLVGSWQANHTLTILATIGLVAATAYSLRIVQKVFHGVEVKQEHTLHDLTLREKLILVPLVVSIIWLGLFPQSVLNVSKPTIQPLTVEAAKNGQAEISASTSEKEETMSRTDFMSVVPLFILTSAAILILFSIAVKRNHKVIYLITTVSLAADFIYLALYKAEAKWIIEPLFIFDGFGSFNTGLILLTALAVTMISYAYFEQREERKEEYYILLILGTLGAVVLVISKHFISLFLGLEILSVSLYSMIAYLRKRERSDEAGIKYLILAAFSSAFLLFGMALVYATTGTMEFAGIGKHLSSAGSLSPILYTGFGLMVVGVGFKLSVVPFHMWAADVYEGAPAPVTAFIATVSKGGMIALLVRFFEQVEGNKYPSLALSFTIIAIASMFIGNFLALRQTNVKRILAYSSIAHMGYLLVAFLAGGKLGAEAVSFYLVAYFITTTGAFGVLATLSDKDRDAEQIDDYRGLFWTRPWTAAIFTAMLLSLAGIPLTAGFIGKFYIVAAGVRGHQWLLVITLAVNSALGLYYYIKIIATMFDQREAGEEEPVDQLHPSIYIVSGVTMALLTVLLVWIGVAPGEILELIQSMVVLN